MPACVDSVCVLSVPIQRQRACEVVGVQTFMWLKQCCSSRALPQPSGPTSNVGAPARSQGAKPATTWLMPSVWPMLLVDRASGKLAEKLASSVLLQILRRVQTLAACSYLKRKLLMQLLLRMQRVCLACDTCLTVHKEHCNINGQQQQAVYQWDAAGIELQWCFDFVHKALIAL